MVSVSSVLFLTDDSCSVSSFLHWALLLPPLNADLWACDPNLSLPSVSGPPIMSLFRISEPCHFKSIHRTSLTLKPESWTRTDLYKKLKQGLCLNLGGLDGDGDGKEVQKVEDICIFMADSW